MISYHRVMGTSIPTSLSARFSPRWIAAGFLVALAVCGAGVARAEEVASASVVEPPAKCTTAEACGAACEGGDPKGCFGLALMLSKGEGVAVNKARAAELYERACSQGEPKGCTQLGLMNIQGDGIPLDKAKAAALYERACTGKIGSGCFNLGAMYEKGNGVPASLEKAAELYKRACDAGSAGGCKAVAAGGRADPPDALLQMLFGATSCDITGKFCVPSGLNWGLTRAEVLQAKIGNIDDDFIGVTERDAAGFVPMNLALGRGEDRKAYFEAAREDIGLLPFLTRLDAEVAPIETARSSPYNIEYGGTDGLWDTPSATVRVSWALSGTGLIGIAVQYHMTADLDLQFLLDKAKEGLAKRFGSSARVIAGDGFATFFLVSSHEVAVVNASVSTGGGKKHFFLSRSVFSKDEAARLRQQTLASAADAFFAERMSTLGLSSKDDVFDYQVSTARRSLEKNPEESIKYIAPLFFLGVREPEIRAIRAQALAALEEKPRVKAAVAEARAKEEVARQKASKDKAAAQSAARTSFWTGVDRDVTPSTAEFDPQLAVGKTVVWSGVVVRRLDGGDYLVSTGGHYWCVSTTARFADIGIVTIKGRVDRVADVVDGFLSTRVPLVTGEPVDVP